MASRFGAKIVPFGVVGEDDIAEVGYLVKLEKLSFHLIIIVFFLSSIIF